MTDLKARSLTTFNDLYDKVTQQGGHLEIYTGEPLRDKNAGRKLASLVMRFPDKPSSAANMTTGNLEAAASKLQKKL